jgi:multidrug transporter EmrE-like cation transporter
MNKLKAVGLALLCAFMITTGQVLWKIAIDRNGGLVNSKLSIIDNISRLLFSPYMISGIVVYCIATIFWMYLLGRYEYSYIYPMLAMSYIISFIYAFYIFNEMITVSKVVAVALIIMGIIVLNK